MTVKTCTVPTTNGEYCEADYPFPAGTEEVNNCGWASVYKTVCEGTNLVSNPYMT